MNNIKMDIIKKYDNLEYDKCMNMINTIVYKGYGVDTTLVDLYISCLIKKHEFDKAYKMIKWFEKTGGEKVYKELSHLYYHCYKLDDAERIIRKIPYDEVDKVLLIKLKIDQGKIDDAKRILNQTLEKEQTPLLLELQKEIDNHYKYNEFLNIGYESFIKQGNKLEAGHIIYLKHKPESLNPTIDNDEKSAIRPYLVWKRIDDKVYIFPMTSKVRTKHYTLYQENYANSKYDRAINENLCFTTEDNILSVNDKIHEEDLKPLFDSLYRNMYSCPSTEIREYYKIFMKEQMGEIRKNNVVVIKDRNTGNKRYKFVFDVNEDSYTVLEIDKYLNIINKVPEKYSKNRLVYKVLLLSGDEINKVRSNISRELLVKDNNNKNNKQKERVRKKVKKRFYHR